MPNFASRNRKETDGDENNAPQQQPSVTTRDLDAEEAETEVFDRIQERHSAAAAAAVSAPTASFDAMPQAPTSTAADVKEKVSRLEADMLARRNRLELVKRSAARPAAMASFYLQEMIEEEETGIGAYRIPSPAGATVGTAGLMKVDSVTSKGGPYQRKGKDLFMPHHHQDIIAESGYVPTDKEGYVSGVDSAGYTFRHKQRNLPRVLKELCAMFHPVRLLFNITDILIKSMFLWVGVPSLLCGAVCFYLLDNPSLYMLPNHTTLAVWFLLITRQTVTLGLSQLTVFVIIDGLMLGTHLAVQTLGPLITLAASTGKGWPATMTTWGLWNLVLIHGTSRFQLNWFFWTEIGLFRQNFGGVLIHSVLYTRILIAAILGGVLVSAKRTIFALRFGRKQVAQFKPRLKRILAEVVLLDEIATLAEQADKPTERVRMHSDQFNSWDMMNPSMVQKNLGDLLWVPKIQYQNSADTEMDSESNATSVADEASTKVRVRDLRKSYEQATKTLPGTMPHESPPQQSIQKLKDMLDSWEAPDTNQNKYSDVSIHEILKFRRALAHLDAEYIFGDAFGSATNRDKCITNSRQVYNRLLKLAEETDQSGTDDGRIKAGVLPFDMLALLCVGDDGTTENQAKKRRIRKLFTPDRSGELPLIAFIQAIDQLYKRLVLLRASLRNASLLDGVLEQLFNGIFYFVLVLFMSSLLELHPWTLMVSITSILVSVSFAFGSSVSAYVDGILLIAIRRPYDLGDRIFFSSADGINPCPDVTSTSWFVEDITLATTTLRYARTNEVCTVNNSSIASSRIINLARSLHAVIQFEFVAHISILENEKFVRFQQEIRKYVEDRPRTWESVRHVRHEMPDVDNESVKIAMAIRHRSAWQEARRIKNDRAAVFRFLYDLGHDLNVHFSGEPEKQVVYQGGVLKRGETADSRAILASSNIRQLQSGGSFQFQ